MLHNWNYTLLTIIHIQYIYNIVYIIDWYISTISLLYCWTSTMIHILFIYIILCIIDYYTVTQVSVATILLSMHYIWHKSPLYATILLKGYMMSYIILKHVQCVQSFRWACGGYIRRGWSVTCRGFPVGLLYLSPFSFQEELRPIKARAMVRRSGCHWPGCPS